MNTRLDPETCIALKPILDAGRVDANERAAYNNWAVHLASTLGISCSDFSSEEIPKQYAELRERITEVVKGLKV